MAKNPQEKKVKIKTHIVGVTCVAKVTHVALFWEFRVTCVTRVTCVHATYFSKTLHVSLVSTRVTHNTKSRLRFNLLCVLNYTLLY